MCIPVLYVHMYVSNFAIILLSEVYKVLLILLLANCFTVQQNNMHTVAIAIS